MHGIVMTGFERFLAEEYGLAPSGFDPAVVYPDTEFESLLERGGAAGGVGRDELQRRFGEYAGRLLFRELYPTYYAAHRDVFSFLLDVEGTIHEIVRSSLPGSAPPHLRVSSLADVGVVIAYTSRRRLCALLEGLVLGIATHYGREVSLQHELCMNRGDPACAVVVTGS